VIKVVKGLPAEWGICSRTVGLVGYPVAIACWQDTLAVGLGSGDIIILNTITGSYMAVLSGHTGSARSLAFSSDGASLVSGSRDNTLKLWDVQTGGVVKTFYGHTDMVRSVSISADCTIIASGSSDGTIQLWDIQTGGCHHVAKQGRECSAVFSPINPKNLIVHGTTQDWDIEGYQVWYTNGHATFSLDGTHFISHSGTVATVQNTDSGAIVAKCQLDINEAIYYSCLSPNGGLAAAATDLEILVWDITDIIGLDPLLIETITTPTRDVVSLTFLSPNTLISASDEQSVKFWQIGISTNPATDDSQSILSHSASNDSQSILSHSASNDSQSILSHSASNDSQDILSHSAPVQSVNLQAEKGIAISRDEDGVVIVWDISTGLYKTSFQTPAIHTFSGDVQMIDDRLIFAWIRTMGIDIWDASEGKLLHSVDVDWNKFGDLRISGDGSKIFCEIDNLLQAWSTQTGEALGRVEVEDGSYLGPCCVDGSKIWVNHRDKPPQGWDFGVSGSSPVQLSNTPSERPHLDFIHYPSEWNKGPSRIEDTVTGKVVFWLSGRYTDHRGVRWDGQYLVAGSQSGEVLILDFKHLCSE
jgi:WD40 repeat protein